jgi:predicted Ser/Thr protein kinase
VTKSAAEPAISLEQLERDERLALLLADLTDRAQAGEVVDIEKYCAEQPDIGVELRQLWATICVTDVARDATIDLNSPREIVDDELELPTRFGDYELIEELGRGGMGVVYKAHQLSLNRTVAVKMILRGTLASEQDRKRFYAEAEAAAQLEHPGIVKVFEVGQQSNRAFFAMQYVQGETLAQVLARGELSGREAATLLCKVSRAIQYAHEKGVLHRDLKPSNIMIDKANEPHVTDFGLAKRFTEKDHETRSGSVVGTPAYMAPEQAAGRRGQIGPASDVYSLGSILYHMLTGRPPFHALSPVDTVLQVLEQEPVPPRNVNRSIDRSLEMVTLKCLQKPAELRYESAGDLANDLQAFLSDEPIAAAEGRLHQVAARLFRETHHAAILENWGLLWMWHSLVLLLACVATNWLYLAGFQQRWPYVALWSTGFVFWAAVFWMFRRRLGPVTFVERQIAHVWGASLICIAALFPLESLMGLSLLKLTPLLGLISGSVFLVKAGMLNGSFYIQAGLLFLTAIPMARYPEYAHFIFGPVVAACFFLPGLKYHRRNLLNRELSARG